MRRFAALCCTLVFVSSAGAETPKVEANPVDAAIDRGLSFLVQDAIGWRAEHKCVSCHHAGLVVWSLREAKRRGYAVDEPLLADYTQWIAESGSGTTGVPRPEAVPRAFNEKAVSLLLALGANPAPDPVSQKGIQLMAATVKSDQLDDGSWAAWPETRPPIFGPSNERATAAATLSLLPLAAAGDEGAQAARDKAVAWLTATRTDDDPQSIALRLILWQRLNRPAEECNALVQRIFARQNSDGGWSQTAELASDAWATGQALYALAEAGITADDVRVRNGQSFLVRTQREDGSWPMISRPTKPGGPGSSSLIPIIGAGSSWAVLGLRGATNDMNLFRDCSLLALFLVTLNPSGCSPVAASDKLTFLRPVPHEVIQRQGFDPRRAHAHEPGGPALGFLAGADRAPTEKRRGSGATDREVRELAIPSAAVERRHRSRSRLDHVAGRSQRLSRNRVCPRAGRRLVSARSSGQAGRHPIGRGSDGTGGRRRSVRGGGPILCGGGRER